MWSALPVLLIAAVLTAACAYWVLRAYRRAGGGAHSATPALVMCAVVAFVALGGYLFIGRPELPDAPYRARLAALQERDRSTLTGDEWLALFGEAARVDPRNPLPHLYAGELLLRQGRAGEAVRAYDAALRREPRLAEALMGLGQALSLENGRVTPEALAAFQQAGALTNDPAPWIYQAMAAMEEGRADDERLLWAEALARMQPDDPRREMAAQMSRERR